MVRRYLFEHANVHFVREGSPTTSEANDFQVDLLREIKGGSANTKRVAESRAPTMCFENGVYVVDGHALNHGANVSVLIPPREKQILRSGWNNLHQVLESFDGA